MKNNIFRFSNCFVVILILLNVFSIFFISGLTFQLTELEELFSKEIGKTIMSQNPQIVEKALPIVAVSMDGEGIIGNLTLRLIPGNDNIMVNTKSVY